MNSTWKDNGSYFSRSIFGSLEVVQIALFVTLYAWRAFFLDRKHFRRPPQGIFLSQNDVSYGGQPLYVEGPWYHLASSYIASGYARLPPRARKRQGKIWNTHRQTSYLNLSYCHRKVCVLTLAPLGGGPKGPLWFFADSSWSTGNFALKLAIPLRATIPHLVSKKLGTRS